MPSRVPAEYAERQRDQHERHELPRLVVMFKQYELAFRPDETQYEHPQEPAPNPFDAGRTIVPLSHPRRAVRTSERGHPW